MAGLLSYGAGLAAFVALTWHHMEDNPTQSTHIVDMGDAQLGPQEHSASIDKFWTSVAV